MATVIPLVMSLIVAFEGHDPPQTPIHRNATAHSDEKAGEQTNPPAENYDPNSVITRCTEAIQLNPRDGATYRARGAAYATMNDHDKAVTDYTKAIELDPHDIQAYCGRGESYRAMVLSGAYRQKGMALWAVMHLAVNDYTEAIRLAPKRSDLNGTVGPKALRPAGFASPLATEFTGVNLCERSAPGSRSCRARIVCP